MVSKITLRVKVSDIIDAPTAFYILRDLETTGKKRSLQNYRPYKLLYQGIGELVVECRDDDDFAVTDLLRSYLSGEAEKLRKGLP